MSKHKKIAVKVMALALVAMPLMGFLPVAEADPPESIADVSRTVKPASASDYRAVAQRYLYLSRNALDAGKTAEAEEYLIKSRIALQKARRAENDAAKKIEDRIYPIDEAYVHTKKLDEENQKLEKSYQKDIQALRKYINQNAGTPDDLEWIRFFWYI